MCCFAAVRMGHLDMDRDTAADYSAIPEFADSVGMAEVAVLEPAGSADMAVAVNVVAVSVNSAVAVDSDSAREPAVLELAGSEDMAAVVNVVAAVVNSAVAVNLVLSLLAEDYLFALAVSVLVDLSMVPVFWMRMKIPMYLSFHLLLYCLCLHFDFLHLSNQY